MDYRGLICVVTDASSGIGREIALQLARRGGTVVGVARGRDNLGRLQQDARRLAGTLVTVCGNVSDAEGMVKERTHGFAGGLAVLASGLVLAGVIALRLGDPSPSTVMRRTGSVPE